MLEKKKEKSQMHFYVYIILLNYFFK